MKLSFVIPAHNEENYVGKCLESIRRFSEGKGYDLEIIVVNNASTDRTKEVAMSYAGVKVIDEERKGLAQARHTGFETSTGDLIANIDADTMLTEGWLETVFSFFANDSDLVALSGPQVFYDVPKTIRYWAQIFYSVGYIAYLINRHVLRVTSVVQGGNFIVRRTALEKIGGFNTAFTFYGEDAYIAKRLHEVGKVVFTYNLPIYASGRRVLVEGKFKIAFRYFANYLWVTFFSKPFTRESHVIRAVPEPEKK